MGEEWLPVSNITRAWGALGLGSTVGLVGEWLSCERRTRFGAWSSGSSRVVAVAVSPNSPLARQHQQHATVETVGREGEMRLGMME